MQFYNRVDAGKQLATRLATLAKEDCIVFGLARGGVPVAYEVARQLQAPLEVMVARKLGIPSNPEYAFGAIAPGGIQIIDQATVAAIGLSQTDIRTVIAQEKNELAQRLTKFRHNRPLPNLAKKTTILVDDGLATGLTATAALRSLRKKHPAQLMLAVPVGSHEAVELLRIEADAVLCLEIPDYLGAIGMWYEHFAQTSDQEVLQLLQGYPHERDPP